ncbi:MAG: hypothetical protein IM319_06265 [Microcystis sp. M113S1]|jgi:hypothetical protein|uniref:hypothetical protein n=1 Tax=Microcystis sp. M113S1 TaxID=2771104 RepID=UPI00258EDD48|nr:hypothetical protein [Microcystis sp. M113S1]MCA2938782.1 hypothetical protein [Microcystis sp. M113S1]
MTRQFHQIMPLLGLLISLLSLYTAQYNLHFAWKNLVMNCQSHRHLEICRDVLSTIEVPDKPLFLRTEENKREGLIEPSEPLFLPTDSYRKPIRVP